ncbi:concanavalin A-like lectin/glucanase [Choiromyces venosus 120613-1]|uniref:Concanavalin A-like lectin/glucanase n=1 Tax=Choiromyces venosus 120613-1 TaxID=1336337 RepID=A0A3N4JTS7_9PEZI|nr:concanavalin A-like lectin/glucanase [Choiromyces venosus 120613-1]
MNSVCQLQFVVEVSIVASILLNAYAALAADFCGQWLSVTTSNNYIIYNNLWGSDSATSGSQCAGLDSASRTTVAWHTTWSWAGGQYNVKSFANANLIFAPKTVANIGSIQSTIRYSRRNVAYVIFTSSTVGSSTSQYEIMIWLAAYGGAGPISSTGSPTATPTIAGYQWRLYDACLLVRSCQLTTSFSGDAKIYTNISGTALQAGTDPFVGTNAKLTVSAFSVVVA